MMRDDFLEAYAAAFGNIQGFFTFDAALMFMAYNQLVNSRNVAGNVLEIGVHHGLSAITVASLRGASSRFFAVDLFEDMQDRNVSVSGAGSRDAFSRNMRMFYSDLNFLNVITGLSSDLSPAELGSEFSFCHIDGGHSPEETYHDLELCTQILIPGGILALDDYFNPSFPGVCEGAVKFKLEHGDKLKPLAIGFNKVLFQKRPETADLNTAFSTAFPTIPKQTSVLWGTPVNYFTSGFVPFFDLKKSTPQLLVLKPEPAIYASFQPFDTQLQALRGQLIKLPVKVENRSGTPFPHGKETFGLSYHLLASSGTMLKYDNKRSFFTAPLQPDADIIIELEVQAPNEPGSYQLELDLVWEGVSWFKEKGNPTCYVALTVK